MALVFIKVCACGAVLRKWKHKYCSARCRRQQTRLTKNAREKKYRTLAQEDDPDGYRRRKREKKRRWHQMPGGKESRRRGERRRERATRRALQLLKFIANFETLSQKAEQAMSTSKDLQAIRAEIKGLSTKELQQQFTSGLQLAHGHLLRVGAILVELESRGVKVDANPQTLKFLRQIGEGKLLADAVVRFASQPKTLAALKKLPLDEQAALLEQDNETVAGRFRKPKASAGRPPAFSLAEQVKNALPADVAEMCLEIIQASADPRAVAERLLPELQRIKNQPARKAAC